MLVRSVSASCTFFLFFVVALCGCGDDGGSTRVDAGSGDGAQTDDLRTIVASDGLRSYWLAPGTSVELAVTVRDESGAPDEGAEVIFVGPNRAAVISGSFDDPIAGKPTYAVRTTDGNGVARATWTADARTGVGLIDAVIAGTDTFVTFGLTQKPTGTEPAITAEAARALAEALPPADTAAPHDLHGPVYVDAGTRVFSPEPPSEDAPAPSIDIEGPTWLFFADDMVGAKFGHPSRFIAVAADAPNPTPEAIEANAYPIIVEPGSSREAPFLPAAFLNGTVLDEPAVASGALREPVRDAVAPAQAALEDPTTACAISIHGPELWGMEADAENFAEFAEDELGIPESQIFTKEDSASFEELQMFLDQAAATGCTKLFLYISSHGYNGTGRDGQGINLWVHGDPDEEKKSNISYDEIAEAVEARFAGKEVCVIIDACYSSTALDWFAGRGFRGEVFTAADRFSESITTMNGGYFTSSLLSCWEDLLDIDPTNGAGAAYRWVLMNAGSKTLDPNPRHGFLNEALNFLDVPDVMVAVGERQTIMIPLPDHLEAEMIEGRTIRHRPVITLTVDGVARVLPNAFVLPNDLELLVVGDAEGMVDYTVTIRVNGQAVQGMGTITVTAPMMCEDEEAMSQAATEIPMQALAIDDPVGYFAGLICGIFDVELPHSDGMSSKEGAGDHTETRARVTHTNGLTNEQVDMIFNNSIFECGSGPNGHTLCPPSVMDMPAGDTHIVMNIMMGPIPLSDGANLYQYGFVFDADGDATNNYEAPPAYPNDFFDGTDRWYVASYAPGSGWSMEVQSAIDGDVQPVPSSARIIIRDETISLVVSASEFMVSEPRYRVTAFRHTGDFGINPPHDWNGDLEPMVSEGLSAF